MGKMKDKIIDEGEMQRQMEYPQSLLDEELEHERMTAEGLGYKRGHSEGLNKGRVQAYNEGWWDGAAHIIIGLVVVLLLIAIGSFIGSQMGQSLTPILVP